MITSLRKKGIKSTPGELAKETMCLYGETTLAKLPEFYKAHDIDLTYRELILVRDQFLTIINRVRKICGEAPLDVELTKSLYPFKDEQNGEIPAGHGAAKKHW